MRFIVGTVDGKVHKSKKFSEREILEHLESVDGHIGTGDLTNLEVRTVEEFVDVMTGLLKYDTRNNTQTFNFETNRGKMRFFNVKHIIWWEIG